MASTSKIMFILLLFSLILPASAPSELLMDNAFSPPSEVSTSNLFTSEYVNARIKQADAATEWISFTSVTPKDSNILPKSRDTTGFYIDTDFFGMYMMKRLMDDGVWYHQLTIPQCGQLSDTLKPSLPQLIRFFEVPEGVKFSLSIFHNDSIVLNGMNVIPAQEFHADLENDSTVYKFLKDDVLYNTDAFYPAQPAVLESDPIVIRGHRLLPVTFYPLQFNPVVQEVRAFSKIEVRISYDYPAQLEETPSRLLSPAFEELIDMLVPNYRYRTDLPIEYPIEWPVTQEREGANYLFIVFDDFAEEIQPLVSWKERKGYITKVVKTSQIKPPSVNPTVTDIYDYIKNAYDTWTPAPSFVLLVGDSEFIPTHYRTPHLDPMHGGFETATDLYYFTVDGDDFFPDIYYGRLSVNSEDETKTVVSKILKYETSPPNDASFYSTILGSAYFQDKDDDDYEDRRYTLTIEELRDYLKNFYTVQRIYTASATDDPQYYSNDYDSGLAIPADLLRSNGFTWDEDKTDIIGNLTAGAFLVYHRDHAGSRNFYNHEESAFWCASDAWSHPSFTHTDIAGLANGDLLPVVLSVECESAWFDGEIDQGNDADLTRNFESFCELIVNQPNGGAIAAIGATRISQSGYNDQLLRGLIDAIWPDFDAAYSTGEVFHLGHMLNYGKVYMTNVYGVDKPKTKQAFEMFHLIGDPELEMWTAMPASFEVDFPTTIGSNGVQEFVVTVTDKDSGNPVDHARVCITNGGNVHQVIYTNPDGQAFFEFTPYGGTLNLTVTKHNFIPYLDNIISTSLGGYISVTPVDGPAGILLSVSGSGFGSAEDVNLYIDSVFITSVTATGTGSITTSFNVPAGAAGFVHITASGVSTNRHGVTLFRRLPDQPLPDIHLYCQWAENTWYLNPDEDNPRWNNPTIQLLDKVTSSPVSSNNLEIGHTYTVKVTIFNDEPAEAVDADVTFEWAFWGAGQKTWYKFGDDVVTVPAAVGSTPGQITSEADWTPALTGHICLMVTLYHPWDKDLDNNNGQENTHVEPVSSPAKVTFTLSNPTSEDALIYLEAHQINEEEFLWPLEIYREYPQIQTPGENKTISVYIDAPEDVKEGEIRTYVINAYLDGKLLGGVEIDFKKTRFTSTTTTKPETTTTTTTIQVTSFYIPVLVVLPLLILNRKRNLR